MSGPDMKRDSQRAADLYDIVITNLYDAVGVIEQRIPDSYRHEQYTQAHKQLNDLIGLFEDLQYEAGMTYENLVEAEEEERERADYERLKAKFGA